MKAGNDDTKSKSSEISNNINNVGKAATYYIG